MHSSVINRQEQKATCHHLYHQTSNKCGGFEVLEPKQNEKPKFVPAHSRALCYSGEVIITSYHTFEMRDENEPWERLLRTQCRMEKAETGRGREQETEINDNVIWWHSWASFSPLVVSQSTNSELKTVNFVWLVFNLPRQTTQSRRYTASVFHFAARELCQVLQVHKHKMRQRGTLTGSLFE